MKKSNKVEEILEINFGYLYLKYVSQSQRKTLYLKLIILILDSRNIYELKKRVT